MRSVGKDIFHSKSVLDIVKPYLSTYLEGKVCVGVDVLGAGMSG